ncbi:epimerase [Paenibacillus sp. FSL H8-0548]|uniref:GDP-mannose 4,6-dehydratase n=1 Tax=Paenibacillus sp. FSL H8-0548 TaxID=1920422 RepID=UPI00096F70B5|nr:GDP-mannose 4,6-dehydratase [Paenibacillus sp. FSL H8-0548]OMF32607.1 epimerase [Paenibacillus sp. FSL H8-0548]
MTTIVVTGGAGFIGSHLCEALLQKGHKVINIDCFNDYYDPAIKRNNVMETQQLVEKLKLADDCYTVEEGDLRDIDFLNRVFEENQVDMIVHLAAYAGVRPSIQNPVLYTDVNINGTVNLLEMSKKHNIKSFVFASSSSVYGNNTKVPFSEEDVVDFPISPYAATKKAGELLCHTYHSLYNINMACLRFFTVYGPRQRPDLAIHKFTKLISEGRPIPYYGDGSSERDYTYIEDIIDGVIKAVEWASEGEKKYEVFNLGESNTINLKRMVEAIEDALGRNAEINKMPMQPGDVNRTFADVSKAKKVLGYKPSWHFEDGISKFVEWMKSVENI